jgi:putative FmdB family regulatory protein
MSKNCPYNRKIKMPVYEYKCLEDDTHPLMSISRSISEDDPGYKCVKCDSEMTRHFTPFGIQFKGQGFYKTDNPK